jgi:hypothetical protein
MRPGQNLSAFGWAVGPSTRVPSTASSTTSLVEYHLAGVYTFGEHQQGVPQLGAGAGSYPRGLVSRCTLSIIRTVPDLERITMEFVRHPPA